jgi:hypothetical protein
MAAVARSRGIEVSVTKLEDWPVVARDVLHAARSWHWIDPPVRARVAARAIRSGGRWLACWNREIDPDIERARDRVYQEHPPQEFAGLAAVAAHGGRRTAVVTMARMSDAAHSAEEAHPGVGLLPPDLTEEQLAAAPVLASVDALLIEDLEEEQDEAFAAALAS